MQIPEDYHHMIYYPAISCPGAVYVNAFISNYLLKWRLLGIDQLKSNIDSIGDNEVVGRNVERTGGGGFCLRV